MKTVILKNNIDTAGRAGINDCGLSAGGVNSSNGIN